MKVISALANLSSESKKLTQFEVKFPGIQKSTTLARIDSELIMNAKRVEEGVDGN